MNKRRKNIIIDTFNIYWTNFWKVLNFPKVKYPLIINMIFRSLILSICILLLSFQSFSQSHVLSIETAVKLAKDNSPDAIIAETKFKNSYWQYRTYIADHYPLLSLDATLPDLSRALTKITLPTGDDAFVQRNLMSTGTNLSLSQNIISTGGTIAVTSGLQRLDILDPNNMLNSPLSHSYLSNPASISFTQPVFGFNSFRWAKKTEPIKYKIAKRQYAQDLEDISLKTVDLFFSLLQAQTALQIAKKNKANNDTIYNISVGRYNLGKLAENDLLQIKLNLLNADLAVQEDQMQVVSAASSFKSFLGININDSLTLEIPDSYDSTQVNLQDAWQQAQLNSVRGIDQDRMILEAMRGVAMAKGTNGFRGNLFAAYGLNRSAPMLDDAYNKPEQQQQIRFGLTLPILDWGRAKGIIETAKAQQLVTEATIKKDKIDFEQEIYLRVTRFNLQQIKLRLSKTADEVSQRRYFIAKARYMIGKIDITDLNIAQNEGDAAHRQHVVSMQDYWSTYFGLRRATLYDFKNKKVLEEEVKMR